MGTPEHCHLNSDISIPEHCPLNSDFGIPEHTTQSVPCPPLPQMLLPQPLLQPASQPASRLPLPVSLQQTSCCAIYLTLLIATVNISVLFAPFPSPVCYTSLCNQPLLPPHYSKPLFSRFSLLILWKVKASKYYYVSFGLLAPRTGAKQKHFSFQPVFFILITLTPTHMKLLALHYFFFQQTEFYFAL